MEFDKYKRLIDTWTGKKEDLCFLLFDMLLKEEMNMQVSLFEKICETIKITSSNETVAIESQYAEGEVQQMIENYGKYIDNIMLTLRKKAYLQQMKKEEFYDLLWTMLMQDVLLKSKKEKAFGLLWIILNVGIPYTELVPSIRMNNDKYKTIIEKYLDKITKLDYIISLPYEQKTEKTSLILNEILSIDSLEEQSVLLAQVLEFEINKATGPVRDFMKMIKDL